MTQASFVKVGRILLKEGAVTEVILGSKSKVDEKKNIYLFLFTDSVMISKLKKKVVKNTMR